MFAGWYEKGSTAERVIEVGDMEMPRAGPGEALVGLYASSALKHRIAATFPLRELAKAHVFAENHTDTGHVVLEID